jgi:tRNA pseudouridine55 synthase
MTGAGGTSDRGAGRGMDGILVVAKPAGPTSHDIVALVRRLTGTRRVGHGGTLDPFASGVLPVFLGLATRVVEYRMADAKAYRATVCFGASSTTDDRDGELTSGLGPAPSRADVEAALEGFRGRIEQRPPDFSARKVGGRRAYELAREGNLPPLSARSVVVDRLELVEWDEADPDRPVAVLEVECGAGTYVRSLARDLGERLGCGAYLGALVRTASGPFRLEAAHSMEELRAAAAGGPAELVRLMLPIDTGLEQMRAVALETPEVEAAARGQPVRPSARPALADGETVRLVDGAGRLVGMGAWRRGGWVAPDKMFVVPAGARTMSGSAASAASRPKRAAEPRLQRVSPGGPAEVIDGIAGLRPDLGRLYLAVGVFDGLHRGHLYLLRELRRAAQRAGARPAVITFDAHPDEVIRGASPALLCDPEERLVRLAAAGVQVTVVQHFDAALRATGYEDFVALLRERVEVAGFVMTPDAAFGHERQGTPAVVAELGQRHGFEVRVVPAFLVDGEPVRSSDVRRLVQLGDLAAAQRLLGRPLSVACRLVRGDPGEARWQAEFQLPFALPPAGRYTVLAGSAWAPGRPAEPAQRQARAVVDASGLVLERLSWHDAAGRVRLVFMGREVSEDGELPA